MLGDFHIADGAAGGQLLEFAFEFEFGEGVDVFPHVHMIGIGVIAFIGNIFNGTETFFINPGKTVAQGFRRSSV